MRDPIGVILAGGSGRRIGGSKAIVELSGRPLITYPLEALRGALADVAVIAKPDTELPNLPGVTLWIEPEMPRHPVVGIVQSLALAAGRPVLVCGVDLPFVTPALITQIIASDPFDAPAVVPTCEGSMQPLLALYLPAAMTLLGRLAPQSDMPLRDQVAAIHPRLIEVDNPEAFFNVNAPEDLLHAAALLDRRA
jgi:molybdopterin-guanine dinucleotide biosynthesis protein A